MSLFEYVSVMVSVILALGIAQVLRGVGVLLSPKEPTQAYWVHSVWLTFFLLLHIQMWWYFWDLRSQPPDTIVQFVFVLLGPSLVYLSVYLLLEGGFPSNAEEHFDGIRRPFFALVIFGTCYQLENPWVLGYEVPIYFRAGAFVQILLGVVGLLVVNRRIHAGIALYFLGALLWALAVRFRVGAFTPE